ncbi:hypothetical protein NC652_004217 [Populus alba x Populus x berolinensis]|nr:hypothetical protein NC652_004217 [Populus alba x Populus x berolinensis]
MRRKRRTEGTRRRKPEPTQGIKKQARGTSEEKKKQGRVSANK